MNNSVKTDMTRRGFLAGGSALLATTAGLGGCKEESKPQEKPQKNPSGAVPQANTVSTNPDWSPQVQKIQRLLQARPNKHIVIYWGHNQPDQKEFFARADFWQMCAANGVTDLFFEQPLDMQGDMDRVADGTAALDDETAMMMLRNAYKFKIRASAADQGYRGENTSDQYNFSLLTAIAWKRHKANKGIHYAPADIVNENADEASYFRKFIDVPDVWKLRQAEKRFSRRRVDDEATGRYSEQKAKQSSGRVVQMWGGWHFSDCGLHTYLDNALILEVFNDWQDWNDERSRRAHSEVFIGNTLHNKTAEYYVFLVNDNEMRYFRPEISDPQMAAAAKQVCLTQTKDIDRLIREENIRHGQNPSAGLQP